MTAPAVAGSGRDVDVVVIGAGILGLAVAAALAQLGRSLLVLERNRGLARETTSRNSEVVHAGIYYPPGSLKAELCRRGRELLYARCRSRGVPHRVLGKLIVACDEGEISALERLWANGRRNGVADLELVGAAEVTALEPDVRGLAGLVSPSSGIVDALALALDYAAEAEAAGAQILQRTEVVALEPGAGGHRVVARSADGGLESVDCAAVVNAAGLASDRVAALAGIDPDARGWRLHPCKGDYFALAAGAPVSISRLIYPLPSKGGLGIHATPDLGGRVRFGPDAEYVDRIRYDVDPAKAEVFAAAIARYLPALRPEWLAPDMAGVRPRLTAPGQAPRDFVVSEESEVGLPGLVNLVGIESPGLTAAPAIAERVAQLLGSL